MNNMLFIAVTFLGFTAFADHQLSGKWKGNTGQMVMYVNEVEQGKANCSEFDVDMKFTETEIFVNKVSSLCGANFRLDFMLTNLTNQNGKVIWEQKQIGILSNSQLRIEHAQEKKKIVLEFKINAGQMDYSYHFNDGVTILELKGKLNKVN